MHVEERVTIRRPAAEVFAFMTDFERRPVYLANVLAAEKTSDGSITVGTTFRERVRVLGQTLSVEYVVQDYQPPRSIRLRTLNGPAQGASTILVHGDETASVCVAMDGDAGGVFKLAGPFVAAAMRRQLLADLATLKGVLESGADKGPGDAVRGND